MQRIDIIWECPECGTWQHASIKNEEELKCGYCSKFIFIIGETETRQKVKVKMFL